MHRLKTENAGNAPGTNRKDEASDAQTLSTKPTAGTLHLQLVRGACPVPKAKRPRLYLIRNSQDARHISNAGIPLDRVRLELKWVASWVRHGHLIRDRATWYGSFARSHARRST